MFIADPALRRPQATSRSLRSESIFAPLTERWQAVLGILMYWYVHCGPCVPAVTDSALLVTLQTDFQLRSRLAAVR